MDGVIFDLDDTLIVEEATARASLTEALASGGARAAADPSSREAVVDTALECARRHWHGSPFADACRRLGIASWEGLWATFEGCHPSLAGLSEWAGTYRRAAWVDMLATLGADAGSAPEAAARYVAAQRRGHPPIDSAIDAARRVSASVPAGVLTNGPPDIQRRKLAQTGLAFAPGTVVVSAEVGVGKPERAAFSLILDRLGTDAARTVMVGDSWERDVLGALAMGIRVVWVSNGRPVPEPRDGVTVVETLTFDVFEGQ